MNLNSRPTTDGGYWAYLGYTPHKGTDDLREIVLLGSDYGHDGSYANERRRDGQDNIDGQHARLHDTELGLPAL